MHAITNPVQNDLGARAWQVVATVPDPEVPVVSVYDLGIVRQVRVDDAGIEVVLTPTYSGCPATETIETDILAALAAAQLGPARVTLQRAPAWTSDWITDAGRDKLRAYGIAPPGKATAAGDHQLHFFDSSTRLQRIACPHCASLQTQQLSAFGSTACKALYRCNSCLEPFEYFKPI